MLLQVGQPNWTRITCEYPRPCQGHFSGSFGLRFRFVLEGHLGSALWLTAPSTFRPRGVAKLADQGILGNAVSSDHVNAANGCHQL